MKLLTYVEKGAYKLGAVNATGVIPLNMPPHDFYTRGLEALPEIKAQAEAQSLRLAESALKLAPVVPHPVKIIARLNPVTANLMSLV